LIVSALIKEKLHTACDIGRQLFEKKENYKFLDFKYLSRNKW